MNKTVLTSFTVLCLLFTLPLLGCKTSVKASLDVIHVPTDYPTIQEAINYANSGDTIFVHNGTYYEHVTVNKSVSLAGEDRDLTIIDGEGTGSVIHVAANNVNISSFTIRKGGKGLYDSSIFIDRCGGNEISHNTITNSSNGICLSYSVRNTVFSNTASDNKYGISLYSSNNNEIYGNGASDNKYGISLYSSNNNEIYGNNASLNKIDGIHLHSSSDNIISSNTVSLNSYDGVCLDFSNNNVVSGNTALNNDYGIRLDSSSNNLVSANTVSNNYYGIYIHSSSNNNTIYHNNFNNTDQVWSDSTNVWNNDDEGNYWSDYAGQDLNGDGIGDNPYVIDVNNQDNHPLMGMFSDFKVTWKEETYHVTTICNSSISDFTLEIGLKTGNKIISFNVTGEDGTVGFCRLMIPTELMNYPCILLFDGEEIIPTLLDTSNETHIHLYFTYVHSSHTITIVSSKLLYLYNELLDKYAKLQIDFDGLNSTYHELLNNYSTLLGSYSQLLEGYNTLNLTTHELLDNYGALLTNYTQLIESYNSLNTTYQELTGNYSQLLERFDTLNASYQEHLLDYSELQENYTSLLLEHAQNIRNLVYVFIATTSMFIMAAAYLSTHAHRKASRS